MSDEFLNKRIEDTLLDGAFPHAKVPRVLFQEDWISKVTEELRRNLVCERRTITLAVSGSALSVAGEGITCLADACLQANHHKLCRVDCRPVKKMELRPRTHGRRMLFVGYAKLRNAEHSPRLVFLGLGGLPWGFGQRSATLLRRDKLNSACANYKGLQCS